MQSVIALEMLRSENMDLSFGCEMLDNYLGKVPRNCVVEVRVIYRINTGNR